MRKRFFGVLAAGLIGLTMAGPVGQAAAAQPQPAAAGLAYTAVDPVRVLDTRRGMPVSASGSVNFDLSGHVPPGASAVALNITAISPTAPTFVTAHDRWTPRPGVSSLNLRPLEIRSNEATVTVNPARPWVTLYNHNGYVNLVADLVGYYSADGEMFFNALASPRRLFDTRPDPTRIPGGGIIIAPLDDVAPGVVPEGASAVVLNVTAHQPTRDTFLSVGGGGYVGPATSTVNVEMGEVTANKAIVALPPGDRKITVRNNAGMVDAFVDILGYYAADGEAYHPVAPVRAFDSRPTATLPHRGFQRIPLAHVVPAAATTVSFNLTGIDYYSGGTYLTAFEAGTPRPGISQLNLNTMQTASNQTVVPLGVSRAVDLYNHLNYPDAIIDLFGYFAPRS
ncbi:MAG: hypothetical protein WBA97_18085 [Actinophytocola sp.]|uniref:hypothetical protein n=1 Tax=Actinophytocola sp. TaxID=1872138 RepID=UPI003C7079A5